MFDNETGKKIQQAQKGNTKGKHNSKTQKQNTKAKHKSETQVMLRSTSELSSRLKIICQI